MRNRASATCADRTASPRSAASDCGRLPGRRERTGKPSALVTAVSPFVVQAIEYVASRHNTVGPKKDVTKPIHQSSRLGGSDAMRNRRDPDAEVGRKVWDRDCPNCLLYDRQQVGWAYLLGWNRTRAWAQCPHCFHRWYTEPVATRTRIKPDQLDRAIEQILEEADH